MYTLEEEEEEVSCTHMEMTFFAKIANFHGYSACNQMNQECVARMTCLYRNYGAVSCVGGNVLSHLHPGVPQGIPSTLIPNCMGSYHGQILIETAKDSSCNHMTHGVMQVNRCPDYIQTCLISLCLGLLTD